MRKREGIEPRYKYATVGADAVCGAEGNINGAIQAQVPMNPPGSKTVARYQGSSGNSGDPRDSSTDGSRAAQPAHQEDARRSLGSRMPPYERRNGGTPIEQREAHMDARSTATPSTPSGGTTATTGIERIAARARWPPAGARTRRARRTWGTGAPCCRSRHG